VWWITNAPRERCLLTLAYSRKLADPPAAQARALHPCIPLDVCSVYLSYFFFFNILSWFFIFFPPVSFLPSLRVSLRFFFLYIYPLLFFEVPKKWGVQRGKVFFRELLMRSLLFLSTQCEELDGPAAGSFVQKMWKKARRNNKMTLAFYYFLKIPPRWYIKF
jgi:hypothetical protein